MAGGALEFSGVIANVCHVLCCAAFWPLHRVGAGGGRAAVVPTPCLRHRQRPTPCRLQVETVDKYQGRDKAVIILSLVRSNPEHKVAGRGGGGEDLARRDGRDQSISAQRSVA